MFCLIKFSSRQIVKSPRCMARFLEQQMPPEIDIYFVSRTGLRLILSKDGGWSKREMDTMKLEASVAAAVRSIALLQSNVGGMDDAWHDTSSSGDGSHPGRSLSAMVHILQKAIRSNYIGNRHGFCLLHQAGPIKTNTIQYFRPYSVNQD